MASQIAAILSAVENVLGDAELDIGYTVTQVYVPMQKLEDVDTAKIMVMPAERAMSKLARGGQTQSDVRIDIALAVKIEGDPRSPTANTEIDAFVEASEDIVALFGPGDYGGAQWLNTENPALFDQDRLLNEQTFLTVITLTFRLFH